MPAATLLSAYAWTPGTFRARCGGSARVSLAAGALRGAPEAVEGVFKKDKIKPEEAMKTGKKRWETGETEVTGADIHGIGTLTGDAAKLAENAKAMMDEIKKLEKAIKGHFKHNAKGHQVRH